MSQLWKKYLVGVCMCGENNDKKTNKGKKKTNEHKKTTTRSNHNNDWTIGKMQGE